MFIQDQFGVIQNLQMSPIAQTSFLVGTFLLPFLTANRLQLLRVHWTKKCKNAGLCTGGRRSSSAENVRGIPHEMCQLAIRTQLGKIGDHYSGPFPLIHTVYKLQVFFLRFPSVCTGVLCLMFLAYHLYKLDGQRFLSNRKNGKTFYLFPKKNWNIFFQLIPIHKRVFLTQ